LTKRKRLKRQRISTLDAANSQDEEIPLESKISKHLAEKNQKIPLILILTTLFCTPIFQSSTFLQPIPAPEFGLDQLMKIYDNNFGGSHVIYNTSYVEFVERMHNYEYPLIELKVPLFGETNITILLVI